jgi:AAA domain
MTTSRKKIQVIMFSGVSGTGKTSIASEIKKRYGERIHVAPSVTRQGYEAWGKSNPKTNIVSEKDYALADKSTRAKFQSFIFSFYVDTVRILAASLPTEVEYLLLERTPFDSLSYAETGGFKITPAQVSAANSLVKDLDPTIFYFPYPVPWFENLEDGFREVSHKKNTAWDVSLKKLLSENLRPYQSINLPHLSVSERTLRVSVQSGLHYNPELELLQTGDVALLKDSPRGKFINTLFKKLTNSEFTHSGVIVRADEGLYLTQVSRKGWSKVRLETLLNRRIHFYRSSRLDTAGQEFIQKISRSCFKHKYYNLGDFLRYPVLSFFGITASESKHRRSCVSYVLDVFSKIDGVQYTDRMYTPTDVPKVLNVKELFCHTPVES